MKRPIGRVVRRQVLLYGVAGGLLVAVLKLAEYRWLVLEHAFEIYGALIAALFSAVGIALGLTWTRRRPPDRAAGDAMPAGPDPAAADAAPALPGPATFVRDERRAADLGLTPRELQVLELIAEGLSTKEIAARAFVSENTVKTHTSRLFDKLAARRRTQAVQRGRELRLIP